MTPSAQPASEHIVVECPACGAYESAEAETLAEYQSMVCRECGETWQVEEMEVEQSRALAQKLAAPRRADAPRRAEASSRRDAPSRGNVIVAEKRPLVTYSDPRDDAWAGKIAGDYWPEPQRHSRLPMIAAAIAALFFLTAFFGGREAAVAALPDLAGLYAAIGLPVNLDGFAIDAVKVERAPTFAGSRLSVHATLRNIGSGEEAIPPLAAVLYSEALVPAGAYGFDPPSETVAAGESVELTMQLDGAPKEAAEVVVRFRRRGETLAVAGAAEPIDP